MNKCLKLRVYSKFGETDTEIKNDISIHSAIDFFVDESDWRSVEIPVDDYISVGECLHIRSGESINRITGNCFSVSEDDLVHDSLFDGPFTDNGCCLSSVTRKLLFDNVKKLMLNKKNRIIYVVLIDEENRVKSVRGSFSVQQFKNIVNNGMMPINTALIVSGYKDTIGINREKAYEIRCPEREETSEKCRKYADIIRKIMNVCNEDELICTEARLTYLSPRKRGEDFKKEELELCIYRILETNKPSTLFCYSFDALLMDGALYIQSFISGKKIVQICDVYGLLCKKTQLFYPFSLEY